MEIPNEKVSVDLILSWLKEQVESHKLIPQSAWLDSAFKLNLLQPDEVHQLELMRQEIAKMKLEILKRQEKRNVAAAELEVEASDEYRFFREQENKVDRVEEHIRIAKKNSDVAY